MMGKIKIILCNGVLVICGHPGIVKIIKHIKARYPNEEIALMMGGFHLMGNNTTELQKILKELVEQGVKRMAPYHCTGEEFSNHAND